MRYLKIYVENTFSGIDSIQPRSVHLQMKRNETKRKNRSIERAKNLCI